MYRRFQDAQLRKTLPQQHGQHLTDRIFGLKVARVDQIQPAPARFLKLMVFEIRRHERITARRKHLIDRAAAAPAANGDTPHRSSGVGEPQPRTGQLFLHKRRKRPHIRLFCLADPEQAIGLSCIVLARRVQDSDVVQLQLRGQRVIDAAGCTVEIRMQIDCCDAVLDQFQNGAPRERRFIDGARGAPFWN